MSEESKGVYITWKKTNVAKDIVSLCRSFRTIGKRYMRVKNKLLSLRTEGEIFPILGL